VGPHCSETSGGTEQGDREPLLLEKRIPLTFGIREGGEGRWIFGLNEDSEVKSLERDSIPRGCHRRDSEETGGRAANRKKKREGGKRPESVRTKRKDPRRKAVWAKPFKNVTESGPHRWGPAGCSREAFHLGSLSVEDYGPDGRPEPEWRQGRDRLQEIIGVGSLGGTRILEERVPGK